MGYYKNQLIIIEGFGHAFQKLIEETRIETPHDTRREIMKMVIAQANVELEQIAQQEFDDNRTDKITPEDAKDPVIREFILNTKKIIKEWDDAQ